MHMEKQRVGMKRWKTKFATGYQNILVLLIVVSQQESVCTRATPVGWNIINGRREFDRCRRGDTASIWGRIAKTRRAIYPIWWMHQAEWSTVL